MSIPIRYVLIETIFRTEKGPCHRHAECSLKEKKNGDFEAVCSCKSGKRGDGVSVCVKGELKNIKIWNFFRSLKFQP